MTTRTEPRPIVLVKHPPTPEATYGWSLGRSGTIRQTSREIAMNCGKSTRSVVYIWQKQHGAEHWKTYAIFENGEMIAW